MSEDVLLDCLIEITHKIGQPASKSSLLSGLPLKNNQLDIQLFPRAASHAGLKARNKKLKLLGKPRHFRIPLVLLLNDQKAALLLEIKNNHMARITRFINGMKREEDISVEKLNEEYSGFAIIVEHDLKTIFNKSKDEVPPGEKAWFWNTVNMLWSSYSEILVASFLISLFALAVPLFMMNVYNRVIPNNIFDTLWVLASGIFIVLGFDVLMRILRSYFIDQTGRAIDLKVSADLLERVLGIRMVDRPLSVGSFANTIQSFDSIREFVSSAVVTILIDVPFAVIFLIVIAMIGGVIVFIPLFMFLAALVVEYTLHRTLKDYARIANRYGNEKQALLHEMLNGIESVKTNCAEPIMQSRWENLVNLSSAVSNKLRFISNVGLFVSVLLQQLASIFVVIAGVYLISENSLTVGGLIACTILTGRALAPMSQIAGLLTRFQKTKTALNQLDKVMNLPLEHPMGYVGLSSEHLKGNIELKNVSFTYPDQNHPVLDNVSIKINEGEKIAVLGRLGSGKTTLSKVLLGLLQPTSGSVFIDTIDQNHYDINELRKKIGYVPQDITLFAGTIHDNITIGAHHVDDSKVINAIKISGADEFVKPQLGDYEALIAERGKNLSGGQKQVIAIARAALLNPPIVVMDEPTNAMDNQTEKFIIGKLESFIKDKTFILMTHHPTLLALVDRIIILDGGHVVADGPKEEILRSLSEGKIVTKKTQ